MSSRADDLPDHIRGLPIETQVAVLYERVRNLNDEVRSLRRALWAFVSSILGGAILFLISVASGWLGHTPTTKAGVVLITIGRWLT